MRLSYWRWTVFRLFLWVDWRATFWARRCPSPVGHVLDRVVRAAAWVWSWAIEPEWAERPDDAEPDQASEGW